MPKGPVRRPPSGYGIDRDEIDGRYYPVRITTLTAGEAAALVHNRFPSGDPSGRSVSYAKRADAVRYLERVVEWHAHSGATV